MSGVSDAQWRKLLQVAAGVDMPMHGGPGEEYLRRQTVDILAAMGLLDLSHLEGPVGLEALPPGSVVAGRRLGEGVLVAVAAGPGWWDVAGEGAAVSTEELRSRMAAADQVRVLVRGQVEEGGR